MTEDNMNEKWVNLEDVANYLSVSKDSVRAWIKAGTIPVYRIGRRYKFKLSEIDKWVRSSFQKSEKE